MPKIAVGKVILSLFLTITSILYLLPNFNAQQYDWLPGKKVNLGLDLRGGSHLLLAVDFESYMNDVSTVLAESIKEHLRREKIGYRDLQVASNSIKFSLRDNQDVSLIKKITNSIDPNIDESIKDDTVCLSYNETALNQLRHKVIEQSIEIVRLRVDSIGTKEPTIQRQGVQNILLQVPGEDNPSQIKAVLGKVAKLAFHLVDEQSSVRNVHNARNAHSASTRERIIPADARIVLGENNESLVIKKKGVISGDQLNRAQAQFKEGQPVVSFALNKIGAKKFAEVTTKHRGQRLAIVLDDKIISAPVINEPIVGGEGIISGHFTVESAAELALLLRSGALPAPLDIIEERTIGPSLGMDSIEHGKKAALISFCLVAAFMLLSYGILGIFANISLIVALIYIFAILAMLDATLTLPGIAGIILTIGMAVDANVLIYERIREELTKGCSNVYAVKVGFETALGTITDSNVTTLIAATCLYVFGIGAIKGFAVSLGVGIVASMYTSIVITKLLVDGWLKYVKPKKLGL